MLKKCLSPIVSLMIVFTLILSPLSVFAEVISQDEPPTETTGRSEAYCLGDANLDSEVDIVDVTTIQRFDARMISLDDTALFLADADQDEEVTIIDATWIQRYVLKMRTPEEIGEPIALPSEYPDSEWVRGYSSVPGGTVRYNKNWRITLPDWVSFPCDVVLMISNGFLYNVFDDQKNKLNEGTSTYKNIFVPAGTRFRANVFRVDEDEAEPADIREFSSALRIIKCMDGVNESEEVDTSTHTIAHQGVPRFAPPETAPSYAMAKWMGLNIVEADVRFTSDNVPVLHHDSTYMIGGVEHKIAKETYEQFMEYDQGSAFSDAYTGTYGLTLEEFLDLCIELELTPAIEFKNGTPEQIMKCLDLIDFKGVKVFNYKASIDNLKIIIDHDPYASVRIGSYNYTEKLYNELVEIINYGEKKHKTHCIFTFGFGNWSSEQIAKCREAGAIMGVSSINNPTRFSRFCEDCEEVDIIFTEEGYNVSAVIAEDRSNKAN